MTVVLGASTPGCTLLELRTELQARGLSDISDDRCDQFLNDAHLEFNEAYNWPWLEQEDVGEAPLTVADFGRVEYVVSAANPDPLFYRTRRWLVAHVDSDLTTTGTPEYWYRTEEGTVNVYPVSTDDITIKYTRTVPELNGDSDETVNPSRYCSVVLDLAKSYALSEDLDNPDLGERTYARAMNRVARIASRVMVDSVEPKFIEG